jgi:hypothetical protein
LINSNLKIIKSYEFNLAEAFLQNNISSPTHLPEWNLLVSKYYGSNFYYFFALEGDELVGICPVHEEKKGIIRDLYSGQYHYIPYGGWILKKDIKLNKLPLKYNQSFVSFNFPDFNIALPQTKNSYKTLIVDLTKTEEEIWEEFINSKRRNMIRKAEKSGVEIKIYKKENCEIFYGLYKEFNEKNNLNNLPLDFFFDLYNSKQINITYFWAFYKEKTLTVNVTIFDKLYSLYWLGISVTGSPNFGQGELLQWAAIKYLKSKGCKYYDLCYIEKERLPHIYEFKKGFSNWEVDIPFFTQKGVCYKYLNRIMRCF